MDKNESKSKGSMHRIYALRIRINESLKIHKHTTKNVEGGKYFQRRCNDCRSLSKAPNKFISKEMHRDCTCKCNILFYQRHLSLSCFASSASVHSTFKHHGVHLKIALYIVQCLRHHRWNNDPKEHDSFLIIIFIFFLPFSWAVSVRTFFVLILLSFRLCLSLNRLNSTSCTPLRSLLLFSIRCLWLSTASKGKHLFRFSDPVCCHCYCEKKHIAFYFSLCFRFTFYFWMGQFQMFLILISECSRREREEKKTNTRSWCWLKVGWMQRLLRYADEYISVLMVVSI